MRRLVALVLLLLLVVLAAVWLVGRTEEDAGVESAVQRSPPTEEEAPPILRGTAGADQEAGAGAPTTTSTSRTVTAPAPDAEAAPAPAREPTHYRITDEIADPEAGAVRLRVVDVGGRPRAGMLVHLNAQGERGYETTHRMTLDANGEARLENVRPGRVYLHLSDGPAFFSTRVEVRAGRLTEVEAVLPVGAVVEGVVRHVEKGVLEGIDVGVHVERDGWTSGGSARTNAEGRYRLGGVPPGTHGVTLRGRAIGYHPRPRAQLVVGDGAHVEHDFVLGRVMIEGRVLDGGTGRALPEVRVDVYPGFAQSTTDGAGLFRLIDLPPGEYSLSFTKDGYAPASRREVEVAEGRVARVDVDLEPAVTLVLRLRDPEGEAVTGSFQLVCKPSDGGKGPARFASRTTDGAGVARYERIEPGTYLVHVDMRGWEAEDVKAVVGTGETVVDIVCRPKADAEPPTLVGTVRDARTRDPLAGVRVEAQAPAMGAAVTNAKGAYALGPYRGSPVRLVVSKEGYGIVFHRGIEVKPDATTTYDIDLAPAAVVHFWVTNARGDPVVGSLVLVVSPKQGTEGTSLGTGLRADADGHAVYEKIVPGEYTLGLISEQHGRGEVQTSVRIGENTVRIQLK